MGKTTNAKKRKTASKSAKPKTSNRKATQQATKTPSERRTENGGYIRFTCSDIMHGRITSSASKAGVSIVAHCLDIVTQGLKAGALAKLPKTLQDAPKNAKPYPCYVNVEMSATVREKCKKLAAKLTCPAHVVVREMVHSATKNARPLTAKDKKRAPAKKRTKPSTGTPTATKKRTTKNAKKRTTAKK